MVELIDWEKVRYDYGNKAYSFSVLGKKIDFVKEYLLLNITEDGKVSLILIDGFSEKERSYCLSDVYLPYLGEIIPLIQTPYVINVIKFLNDGISSFPPTLKESHKGFRDRLTTALLICEYFSLKGYTGLSEVKISEIKVFEASIQNGWYYALDIKNRFELRLKEIEVSDWVIQKTKKQGKRYTFNLNRFKKLIGTSLYNKSFNAIPSEVAEQIPINVQLRTPYKYNGSSDKCLKKGDLCTILIRANELFKTADITKQMLNPYQKAAEKGVINSKLDVVPKIEDVVNTMKFVLATTKTGEVLANYLSRISDILLDSKLTRASKQDSVNKTILKIPPIEFGDIKVTINGYRKPNRLYKKKEYVLTLGNAYKAYMASVGYSCIGITGWRLNEIVHPVLGLNSNVLDTDYMSKLTVVNRYIEKGSKDLYERETTAVGLLFGVLQENLHKNNLRFAYNYDDGDPLYSVKTASISYSADTLSIRPEFSSRTIEQNPLIYLAKKNGIKIPSPRQMRRFFAVSFFYQYDNSSLMALKNHYGHDYITTTIGYVTDTQSQTSYNRIKNKIPIKDIPTSNDPEFKRIFEQARDAKLKDLVLKALNGESQGGYQKAMRTIFRKIYSDTVFDGLTKVQRDKAITDVYVQAKSEGYSVEPYVHGNCTNSIKHSHSKQANCNYDDNMARENASPKVCLGCPFHDVQKQNIENLKSQLDFLKSNSVNDDIEVIFSSIKTPYEQELEKEMINDLTKIIYLYESNCYE
ncbi:TPA: hypothetical protein ACX6PT_000820 [Photobacterium damselae]